MRFEFDFAERIHDKSVLKLLVLRVCKESVTDLVADMNGRFRPETADIIWRDWQILGDEHDKPTVTFTRPISEIDSCLEVEFEVLVKANLFGVEIKPDHIWLPNGKTIGSSEPACELSHSTLFRGKAKIATTIFPYVFELTDKSSPILIQDIMLSRPLIRQIVESLESHGIYVKSVVQKEHAIELSNLPVKKYTWDIVGRYYIQLSPIDVHLYISDNSSVGIETLENTMKKCQICVNIYLRALVNSRTCRQMASDIREQCTQIERLIYGAIDKPA